MKKIREKLKEIWNKEFNTKELCLLTFIISAVIISIIYVLNEVTPFGDKMLLQIDFYHQYGPMLGELYDRIHNSSSLIYSFNMGLGLPLFRNLLNYMSSPFNIIMLLFKRKDLITSFSIIIALKAVVTAVTMVYYLSKKYKTTELYLISFGIIYAFSAYFSAYYWNLMWIDGMLYLPLITLGIERIIDGKKKKTYIISLALMLLTNYYIGYMVCIYSCLYFLVYSFDKFIFQKGDIIKSLKQFVKDGLKFIYASLLAGGIISIFLIPLYYSISSISATGGDIPTSQYYLFSLTDFFNYHFSGIMTTVLASGELTAPNVSCGILAFALLLAFIINVEVPIKEKIGYIFLLGFFILAFFYAPLDYILQGFHVPNDLPYRYSFIYSFVLVLISVYSFRNIKKINYRLVMLIYIFLSLALLTMANTNYVGISTNMIYINMALLTIYFIIYMVTNNQKNNLKIISIIMILIATCDAILSVNENFDIPYDYESFYSDYDEVQDKLNYIKNNDNELFYRIEKENRLTLNDTSWYNYYGMTGFSSMNYEDMAIMQNDLGMAGNYINSYIYNETTPIYDTMFDIKYFIGASHDNKRYTQLEYDDLIYKYNYTVGLGYGVNKKIYEWEKEYDNPFDMQNEYIKLATSINNVLLPIDTTGKEIIYKDDKEIIVKYTFNNPGDNVYFYGKNEDVDYYIVNKCLYYYNDNYNDYNDIIDSLYYRLDDYNESHIINFKSNQSKIDIYVGYNYSEYKPIKLYTIDNQKFIDVIHKLQQNKLNITSFKETKIKGNITLEDDMVVYTSIPYDEGWNVLVDNKKVATKALNKSLLTFAVPSGNHEVIIYYKIKGLGIGITISLVSLILLLADIFNYKKIITLRRKK